MADAEAAAERVESWVQAYIDNSDAPADTLAVSFPDAPLYLSDIRELLDEHR